MRSMASGSRPSTVIAADSCRYASTARAPKNVSRAPTSPSSVCTRTQSTLGKFVEPYRLQGRRLHAPLPRPRPRRSEAGAAGHRSRPVPRIWQSREIVRSRPVSRSRLPAVRTRAAGHRRRNPDSLPGAGANGRRGSLQRWGRGCTTTRSRERSTPIQGFRSARGWLTPDRRGCPNASCSKAVTRGSNHSIRCGTVTTSTPLRPPPDGAGALPLPVRSGARLARDVRDLARRGRSVRGSPVLRGDRPGHRAGRGAPDPDAHHPRPAVHRDRQHLLGSTDGGDPPRHRGAVSLCRLRLRDPSAIGATSGSAMH